MREAAQYYSITTKRRLEVSMTNVKIKFSKADRIQTSFVGKGYQGESKLTLSVL